MIGYQIHINHFEFNLNKSYSPFRMMPKKRRSDDEWDDIDWGDPNPPHSSNRSLIDITPKRTAKKPKLADNDGFSDDDFELSFELSSSISHKNAKPILPSWTPKVKNRRQLTYPLERHQLDEFLATKKIKKMYDWQDECLRMRGPIMGANLVYSLPTSAGKSLVAEVHLMRHLLEGECALLVLPFVSIVQEKVTAMTALAVTTRLKFVVEEYAAGKGAIPPTKHRERPCLFVATIEKASQLVAAAITGTGPWLPCVVIDELHMIGEGVRGARLESLIAKLVYVSKRQARPVQMIGMSATLPNLSEIAAFMGNAELFVSDYRPVPLVQYLKLNQFVHRLVEPDGQTKYARTVSSKRAQLDPDGIGELVLEVVPQHSVLIFCPTRKNCQSVAKLVAAYLSEVVVDEAALVERGDMVRALDQEMSEIGGVSDDYRLLLMAGCAYHHAGLSGVERVTIEDAFRSGLVKVLCCTSTLAAGVNLPARRGIIRSMAQGRNQMEQATYRQMVGRAGRAGFDSQGESVLIAPPSDKRKALELMNGELKKASSQLGGQLEENILTILSLGLSVTRNELLEYLKRFTLFGAQHQHPEKFDDMLDHVLVQLEQFSVVEKKEAVVDGLALGDIDIRVTRLGTACIESGHEPRLCHVIWNKLKSSRERLNLANGMQLLSLTITDEIVGETRRLPFDRFLSQFNQLDEEEKRAMKTIGIDTRELMRHQCGRGVTKSHHIKSFYALLMYAICKGKHPVLVADSFGVERGQVQRHFTATISEAARLSVFCAKMDELWFFSPLFEKLVISLGYGQYPELMELMQINQMKSIRARQLYDAEVTTPAQLAQMTGGIDIVNIILMS